MHRPTDTVPVALRPSACVHSRQLRHPGPHRTGAALRNRTKLRDFAAPNPNLSASPSRLPSVDHQPPAKETRRSSTEKRKGVRVRGGGADFLRVALHETSCGQYVPSDVLRAVPPTQAGLPRSHPNELALPNTTTHTSISVRTTGPRLFSNWIGCPAEIFFARCRYVTRA